MRSLAWSVVYGALIILLAPGLSRAGFIGAGTNTETKNAVSGEADFSVSGSTLTVVLTNTGSPTPGQGDALTGVTFDISAPGTSPTLTLSSIALTSGSTIWTSANKSSTTSPLSGSWTADLTSTTLGNSGVATTGFGIFKGSSITQGNASPDYGIVAPNTFPSSSFGGSKFPFIQNSLTFTFNITGSSFTASDINSVDLLFGTSGTGIIHTHEVVAPAPPSIVLCGFGCLCLAGFLIVSRRRKVVAA
ncbi:MAG TPA: XDD4 family exosortase-dependent surface protein [Gemmataceae bacterium]|jgi:hypothetical protein